MTIALLVLLAGSFVIVRSRASSDAARKRADGIFGAGAVLAGVIAGVVLVLATPGELSRSAYQSSVVLSGDEPPGPMAVIAATELALGDDLHAKQVSDVKTDSKRVTSFEISRRFAGITIGTACIEQHELSGGKATYYLTRKNGC